MQKLSINLVKVPIISLRTGGQVGVALRPLINPDNLKIEAWFATSIYETGTLILPSIEIREISSFGIAINDHESITPAEDLVRYKNLVSLDFQLVGKTVMTESHHKLGKVEDYSADLESFYIQRLYVNPALLKAFSSKRLTVSRNQIVEINDRSIIIKGPEVKVNSFFGRGVQEAEA